MRQVIGADATLAPPSGRARAPPMVNPVLGATPLADHHGVPWAGPALIVLAVKSPLADHHGAFAHLSSPLGRLTCIECRLSILDNEYVFRTSSDDLGLNNRCRTNGYMMVVLRIWQCRNLRFPHKLRASL